MKSLRTAQESKLMIIGKTKIRWVVLIFSWCLTWLIPRDKDLIAFSQVNEIYADNSRALFEWCAQHEYKVLWIYGTKRPKPEGISQSLFVRRHSFRGFWTAARAGAAVVIYGSGDFGIWTKIIKKSQLVMLWHGIAIKNLGVLDHKIDSKTVYAETKNYAAIIASSEIDRYYTASHQNVPIQKIHVTGLSRNDHLIRKRQNRVKRESLVSILYAPTFRDFETDRDTLFFPFPDFDVEKIVSKLRNVGARIMLRPHPYDEASCLHVETLSSSYNDVFKYYTSSQVEDTAEIMDEIDIVITDYSSIYIDFLLADTPCIFIPFDMAKYEQARGIAYNYETITPGPKVKSQHDFLLAIDEAMDGAKKWRQHRHVVRKLFHAYEDGNACLRVAKLIESLLTTQKFT
jgi:CDP-glycerol glycerophosphotransferase